MIAQVVGCWCLCCFDFKGNCRANFENSPYRFLILHHFLQWSMDSFLLAYFNPHKSLQSDLGLAQYHPLFHHQCRLSLQTCLQVFYLPHLNRPTCYSWIAWVFSLELLEPKFSFVSKALQTLSSIALFSSLCQVVFVLLLQHQFSMALSNYRRSQLHHQRFLHLDQVWFVIWDHQGKGFLLKIWYACWVLKPNNSISASGQDSLALRLLSLNPCFVQGSWHDASREGQALGSSSFRRMAFLVEGFLTVLFLVVI